MIGRYELEETMGVQIGALNVRRNIFINASPSRVWREFNSFEAIAAWFGRGHTLHALDLRLGGECAFSVEIEGERRAYGGKIIVFEPEREMTMEWNWEKPWSWPAPTLVTIRLTPLYDGTLVEIFHHGFERFGIQAADELEGYEQGWRMNHLTALRATIER
jgi:uncharacterized protein YndB with AHSA1/START domain